MSTDYESRISRLQEKLDDAEREIAELRRELKWALTKPAHIRAVENAIRNFPPTAEQIETNYLERRSGR